MSDGKPAKDPSRQRLTPKRVAFIDEYVIDLNAGRAAKAAGYSAEGGSQYTSGYRLLRIPCVRAAVDARLEEKGSIRDITVDRVLEMLLETQRAAHEAGQYAAANKAAEMLAKHIGMLKDKLEIDFKTSFASLVEGSEGDAPIEAQDEPGDDDDGDE